MAAPEKEALFEKGPREEGSISDETETSEGEDSSEDETEGRRHCGRDQPKYGGLHGWYMKKWRLQNITKDITVPLKKVSIKAQVDGSIAKVCVAQRYVYSGRRTLKDVYFIYSDEENCKVTEVTANVGGKIMMYHEEEEIESTIKDNGGKEMGKAILAKEKDCVRGRRISKIRIGQLKKDTEVIFAIKYSNDSCVTEENGCSRLIIPTTIVPDSEPLAKRPANPRLKRMDYPYQTYVKFPMEIEVTGVMKGKVKHVSCSSHLIESVEENSSAGTIILLGLLYLRHLSPEQIFQ